MKSLTLLFAVMVMILFSCLKDTRLDEYNKIVDSADKIIFYTKIGERFNMIKEVDSLKYLEHLKSILKRNIKPEDQRKVAEENKIEILNQGKIVGVLVIKRTGGNPFVNFKSDKVNFGFKLTYGIGMSL